MESNAFGRLVVGLLLSLGCSGQYIDWVKQVKNKPNIPSPPFNYATEITNKPHTAIVGAATTSVSTPYYYGQGTGNGYARVANIYPDLVKFGVLQSYTSEADNTLVQDFGFGHFVEVKNPYSAGVAVFAHTYAGTDVANIQAGNIIANAAPTTNRSLAGVSMNALELDVEPSYGTKINQSGTSGLFINGFSEKLSTVLQTGSIEGGVWLNGFALYGFDDNATGLFTGVYPSYDVVDVASNGGKIQLRIRVHGSTMSPYDLQTGTTVTITGIGGSPTANGTWVLTRSMLTDTTGLASNGSISNNQLFTLDGSTYGSGYTKVCTGCVSRKYGMNAFIDTTSVNMKSGSAISLGNNQAISMKGTDGSYAKIVNDSNNYLVVVPGSTGLTAFRNATNSAPGDIQARIIDSLEGTVNTRVASSSSNSVGYIGTTTAHSLNIQTNSTTRIAIGATGTIILGGIPTYADNTAAAAGGLAAGSIYRTATGVLMIRY